MLEYETDATLAAALEPAAVVTATAAVPEDPAGAAAIR